MAMINCPECGAEISDQAETCPHCGRKSDATKKEETAAGCGSSLISLGTGLTILITIPCLLLIFCGF